MNPGWADVRRAYLYKKAAQITNTNVSRREATEVSREGTNVNDICGLARWLRSPVRYRL